MHISEVPKGRSSSYRIFYRWLGYVAIPAGLLSICCSLPAQTSQPATSQTPKTSPATARILASFEGQNVTSVQIAGRPESTTAKFSPLFVQQAGQPFSKEKVEQTVAALKATGKFKEIQLQVDPEANGVRVLLVLEPAVYFGMFKFPGAEQFPYSRLIQVALCDI